MRASVADRLRELRELYWLHRSDPFPRVAVLVERMRAVERLIESKLGAPLVGKRMLEIGPGQRLPQMSCFALKNNIVGVDKDVILQKLTVVGLWEVFRANGLTRMLKTLGRKALRTDAKFWRELARYLQVKRIPRLRVLRMDASSIDLPHSSFDCVVSFALFEHLAAPEAVMREVRRLLKRGGVAYIALHLYTSETGSHDPRVFSGNRADLPYWAHLRPAYQAKVRPNAYLNRIRLADWRRLFEREWPGVEFVYHKSRDGRLISDLKKLRDQGEISEYGDDE